MVYNFEKRSVKFVNLKVGNYSLFLGDTQEFVLHHVYINVLEETSTHPLPNVDPFSFRPKPKETESPRSWSVNFSFRDFYTVFFCYFMCG